MRRFMCVLTVLPGLAVAEPFVALNGDEVSQALKGRALVYTDGATQDFRPSGATLYNAGRDSWGYWAVRGDQYCSQWPPSDLWACYDMARSGDVLRFIAEDGSATDGVYAD